MCFNLGDFADLLRVLAGVGKEKIRAFYYDQLGNSG
jgi:hypothetical protein